MSTTSTLWGFTLPFVTEHEADAEAQVNKVLRWLDLLVDLKATGHGDDGAQDETADAGTPAENDIYLLATSGVTGTNWAGHEGEVAAYFDGAWEFLPLPPHVTFYSMSSGAWRRNDGATPSYKNLTI